MKIFYHDIITTPQCYLDETNQKHVYITPDGKKLTSVTAMLQKTKPEADMQSIAEWREIVGKQVSNYILEQSGVVGRQTHKLNENYINMIKESNDFLLLSYAHHRNFLPYLNKITRVYGIEAKLFSYDMKLAGTADCIAEYDGKLSIIDYKTKRSPQKQEWITDYFIQTTAYAKMWYELTDQRIEQLVILVSSEQNTRQEFVASPEEYENALTERLLRFHSILC